MGNGENLSAELLKVKDEIKKEFTDKFINKVCDKIKEEIKVDPCVIDVYYTRPGTSKPAFWKTMWKFLNDSYDDMVQCFADVLKTRNEQN